MVNPNNFTKDGDYLWRYEKDGKWYTTRGVPAQKKFYNAVENIRREFPNIAKKEFEKYK